MTLEDAQQSLGLLRASVELARSGQLAFYRVAALQLRLLLCDTTRRHAETVDISLLPRVLPDLQLRLPLLDGGADPASESVALPVWLESHLHLYGHSPITIRAFIRRVCDQRGGAHVDPKPEAGLPDSPEVAAWVLALGECLLEEVDGKLYIPHFGGLRHATHAPSYTNPKLELRPCPEKGGWGLFAARQLEKDELICVWGGECLTTAELDDEPPERARHGIQIEDDVYMIPLVEGDPADYINHSCNPNAWLRGQISLIARRKINPHEEICFDYATSDASDYDEFECHCGLPGCRKRITGADWRLPELHERYAGHFSPYIQQRIDALNKT